MKNTTEQQMTNLAAQIKKFDFDGNFVEIYFMPDVYSINQIHTMLNDFGIKDIVYSNIDTCGMKVESYSFILKNMPNSNQKGIINNLANHFVRMKALKDLHKCGGFALTEAEQKYFQNAK